MSNDDTATVSSPENFSGRARSAHSTRWPAPTWVPLPSSRTYEGIQSSIVVFATAVRSSFSDFFERRPSRVKSGAGASMSGDATVTTRTCVPTSLASSTLPSIVKVAMSSGSLRFEMSYMVKSGLRAEPRRPGLTDLSSWSLKTSRRLPDRNTFRAVDPGRVFCRVSSPAPS